MKHALSPFFIMILFASVLALQADDEATIATMDPLYIYGSRLNPLFEDFNGDFFDELRDQVSIFSSIQSLEGTHFFHPLGAAGNSELIVRGGEPNYTKVRIDGIEVNNSLDHRGGGFAFASLAGMPVQALQLQKGSLSSLEGSGALNGILAFELGSPSGESYVRGSTASTGWASGDAVTRLESGRFDSQVGVHSTRESGRFRDHEFESRGGFLRTRIDAGTGGTWDASLWSTSSEQIRLPEDSGGLRYSESDELETVETDTVGLSLRYRQQNLENAQVSVTLGRYAIDTLSDSPGVAGGPRNPMGIPGNRFDDAFRRLQAEADLKWTANEHIDLVLGTAFHRETAESRSIVHLFPGFSLPSEYDVKRDSQSIFAELGLSWSEAHALQFSQRMEDLSGLDAEWSSGVRFLTRTRFLNSTLDLSFREAFKAPSLFALNNGLVGNPELDAERSHTWELGLSGILPGTEAGWRVSVFRQDYENLVDMSELSQRLENLDSLQISGLEASMWFNLHPKLRWSMDVAALDYDLDTPGEILRHRPKAQLTTRLHWYAHDDHELTLSLRWTGRRWDSSIPTGNRELSADTAVFVHWRWQIAASLYSSVELHNLLNKRQEVLIGYPNPETSAWVSLTWKWGT